MNHSHQFLTSSSGAPALALPSPLPSVFDYEDYHAFLRDWVAARKTMRPTFSFQAFASRAGIKSRSFLRLVCLGERGLGPGAAYDVSVALGLDPLEQEHFLDLVTKSKVGRHQSTGLRLVRRKLVICDPEEPFSPLNRRETSSRANKALEVRLSWKVSVELGVAELAELRERVKIYQIELGNWLREMEFQSLPEKRKP